jgi:hypothetical protein
VSFELLSAERTANGITAAEILVYVSSVPSLGYATYYAVPSLEPMPVANVSQGNTIENEFFRITVDPAMGGGIVSLYDKTARRELMQTENGVCTKPGNELIRLAEDPARKEPPWEIFTTGFSPGIFVQRWKSKKGRYSLNSPYGVKWETKPIHRQSCYTKECDG